MQVTQSRECFLFLSEALHAGGNGGVRVQQLHGDIRPAVLLGHEHAALTTFADEFGQSVSATNRASDPIPIDHFHIGVRKESVFAVPVESGQEFPQLGKGIDIERL